VHDEGRQSEFDIEASPPRLFIKLARHRPRRVISGRLGLATFGALSLDTRDHTIDDGPRQRVRNRGDHRDAGIVTAVPAVTGRLEQVRMHVGVFVEAKREVFAQRQRRITLAQDVGGEMKAVYEPAGEKQSRRNTARRETPGSDLMVYIFLSHIFLSGVLPMLVKK